VRFWPKSIALTAPTEDWLEGISQCQTEPGGIEVGGMSKAKYPFQAGCIRYITMILYFRLKQCNVIAKEDHHFTSNVFRKKMLAGQTCPGAVCAKRLNFRIPDNTVKQ